MPTDNPTGKRKVSTHLGSDNEPRQKRKHSDLTSSDKTSPKTHDRHKRPRTQDGQDLDKPSPKCAIADLVEKLVAETANKSDIDSARDNLRCHFQETAVLFFLELTPSSIARGAACKHPDCDRKIKEHNYRIAVYPGMYSFHKSADFYHVKCFEELADFSKQEYLKRLHPLTRATFTLRDIRSTSILGGNYLVDGGAERLVLQWIHSMESLMARRDGIKQEPLDPDLKDILLKAGSAAFSPRKPEAMSELEFSNLCHTLAPIESAGAEDKEEWNLFDNYLPISLDDLKDLEKPHSLSFMLSYWHVSKFLANSEVDSLNDEAKEARKKFSEKAISGIQRLSTIPMPSFQ